MRNGSLLLPRSIMSQFCERTTTCGSITEGRTRVAHLKITTQYSACPANLSITKSSNKFACRPPSINPMCYPSSIQPTCSVILASEGNIKAYALGSLNAFERCLTSITADKSYICRWNYSQPHTSRQLIWTFAAGKCPCTRSLPPFVGEKSSCDSSCKQITSLF